jgi:hypothetical protein
LPKLFKTIYLPQAVYEEIKSNLWSPIWNIGLLYL